MANGIKATTNNFKVDIDLDSFLDSLSDDVLEVVKEGSPVGESKSKKYKDGWDKKKKKNERVIYNKNKPSLTHLINNGHLSKSGERVAPIPHITIGQQFAKDNYYKYEEKIKIKTK